tara:strand:- start:148 stop:423 length:276 start_codon:yes stop_codon:yes gene_type:complete
VVLKFLADAREVLFKFLCAEKVYYSVDEPNIGEAGQFPNKIFLFTRHLIQKPNQGELYQLIPRVQTMTCQNLLKKAPRKTDRSILLPIVFV